MIRSLSFLAAQHHFLLQRMNEFLVGNALIAVPIHLLEYPEMLIRFPDPAFLQEDLELLLIQVTVGIAVIGTVDATFIRQGEISGQQQKKRQQQAYGVTIFHGHNRLLSQLSSIIVTPETGNIDLVFIVGTPIGAGMTAIAVAEGTDPRIASYQAWRYFPVFMHEIR